MRCPASGKTKWPRGAGGHVSWPPAWHNKLLTPGHLRDPTPLVANWPQCLGRRADPGWTLTQAQPQIWEICSCRSPEQLPVFCNRSFSRGTYLVTGGMKTLVAASGVTAAEAWQKNEAVVKRIQKSAVFLLTGGSAQRSIRSARDRLPMCEHASVSTQRQGRVRSRPRAGRAATSSRRTCWPPAPMASAVRPLSVR